MIIILNNRPSNHPSRVSRCWEFSRNDKMPCLGFKQQLNEVERERGGGEAYTVKEGDAVGE